MRAGLREAAARAVLALGSAGLVLVLAEGGLRISAWEPEAFRPPIRVIDTGRTTLLDCYPTDPRGYFPLDLRDAAVFARYAAAGMRRLERAAGRAPHCVEVRYNAERFRGPEVPARRPGVWRVLVLGDSFSEGQGVREEDTWPRRLEALLDRDGGAQVEVLNAAHRASDFPELHEWFYRLLNHEPDVVIYAMVPNDAEQSPAFRERSRAVEDWITVRGRATRGRYRDLGPFDSRLGFLVRERLERLRIDRATRRWYRGLYGEANQAGWSETRKRIRDMDERMRLRRGRLLVARWPLLAGLAGSYPFQETHDRVGSALEAIGVTAHDLLPALLGESAEELVVHPSDRHPNERAHRLVADSLEPVVRAMVDELARQRAPRSIRAGRRRPLSARGSRGEPSPGDLVLDLEVDPVALDPVLALFGVGARREALPLGGELDEGAVGHLQLEVATVAHPAGGPDEVVGGVGRQRQVPVHVGSPRLSGSYAV